MAIIDRADVLGETVARLNGWDRGFPHANSKASETSESNGGNLPKPSGRTRDIWEDSLGKLGCCVRCGL